MTVGAKQRLEVHRVILGEKAISLRVIARAYAQEPRTSVLESELRELLIAKAFEEGPAL